MAIGASLKTPNAIGSLPNKLYGTAKATPMGRRRGPAAKSVGKPDAGNLHVRFDERGRETGRCRMAQATAPFLDSTVIRSNPPPLSPNPTSIAWLFQAPASSAPR